MNWPLLHVNLEVEADVVSARQRAWQLAELLGFERADRTRIATALSELVRNALVYAKGGDVRFALDGARTPQRLEIEVRDCGPGIEAIDEVLAGRYQSRTGMGLGIIGAKRLMDDFEIETAPGRGTRIRLGCDLPRKAHWKRTDLDGLTARLPRGQGTDSSLEVLRQQNQELLDSLDRIRRREEEAVRLRTELEDTNRGVVALYAELDARAEQLRQASELKTKFLSNMSHEFRTPLNSILALCGLLRDRVDGDLTPEQERQVSYIRRSADDLLALVNDLLDLAKVEAGRIDVRPERFRLDELFSALRGALKPLQTSPDVELVFEAAAGLPELNTDESKVAQIVRNLVSNALKFTLNGSVRVQAKSAAAADRLVISVTDTGVGIPADHLEAIFEEFSQVDHALQRKVRGTGLGLPLSRKLAQLLGGDISVESRVGEGSTFTLELPVRFAPAVLARDVMRRALVIDDDETFRYVLGQSLRSCGAFEIVEAREGEQGLRLAREVRPDVIVLDLQMPEHDGFEVLRELDRDADLRATPVIVASSMLVSEQVRATLPPHALVLPKQSLSRDVLESLLLEAFSRGERHA